MERRQCNIGTTPCLPSPEESSRARGLRHSRWAGIHAESRNQQRQLSLGASTSTASRSSSTCTRPRSSTPGPKILWAWCNGWRGSHLLRALLAAEPALISTREAPEWTLWMILAWDRTSELVKMETRCCSRWASSLPCLPFLHRSFLRVSSFVLRIRRHACRILVHYFEGDTSTVNCWMHIYVWMINDLLLL